MTRYGYPYIFGSIFATLLTFVIWFFLWRHYVLMVIGLIFLALTLLILNFFRDPEREIPQSIGALVSPADGKVISVDTINAPMYIKGKCIRVAVFLSVFDVHVNRIPYAGKIEFLKYVPGKFLPAFNEKVDELNERMYVGFRHKNSRFLVVQIAGILARRIVYNLREGQEVAKGERYGMIKFGSRTDFYFPLKTNVLVKPGDRVRGGASIIGEWSGE